MPNLPHKSKNLLITVLSISILAFSLLFAGNKVFFNSSVPEVALAEANNVCDTGEPWCVTFYCPEGDTDGNGECKDGDRGVTKVVGSGRDCPDPSVNDVLCGQVDYYSGGTPGQSWECLTDFKGPYWNPQCSPSGGGNPPLVCEGVKYDFADQKEFYPPGKEIKIIVDRSQATSCTGNWNDIDYIVDATPEEVDAARKDKEKEKALWEKIGWKGAKPIGNDKYEITILPKFVTPGEHTVRLLVNNNDSDVGDLCVCNPIKFTVKEVQPPEQKPVISCLGLSGFAYKNNPSEKISLDKLPKGFNGKVRLECTGFSSNSKYPINEITFKFKKLNGGVQAQRVTQLGSPKECVYTYTGGASGIKGYCYKGYADFPITGKGTYDANAQVCADFNGTKICDPQDSSTPGGGSGGNVGGGGGDG